MADPTEHGIPRAVVIAWGMLKTPQSGPSRGMSLNQIIEAAMAIADADGLAAVTMKRVAEALGFTTMSLYRYVASKDDLLLLMQDAATQLPTESQELAPPNWRQGIRRLATQLWEIYRRRPWLLELPRGQASLLMPNSMAILDRALTLMEPLRLDFSQKIAAVMNISMMAIAFAQLELELSGQERVSVSPEGLILLSQAIGTERFPALGPRLRAGDYIAGGNSGTAPEVDLELAMGLEWIIAGIERLDAAADS